MTVNAKESSTSQHSMTKSGMIGACSGLLVGALLQPLEIIKINIIINPKGAQSLAESNIVTAFYRSSQLVYKYEGMKGFWRGTTPAILKLGMSSSMYFSLLSGFQQILEKFTKLSENKVDALSSAFARTLSGKQNIPLTNFLKKKELPY